MDKSEHGENSEVKNSPLKLPQINLCPACAAIALTSPFGDELKEQQTVSTPRSQLPSQPCYPCTRKGWELLVPLNQKIPIFITENFFSGEALNGSGM